MNGNNELIYSNDLCAAFLTLIVQSFQKQIADSYLGRTKLQKLAYFSQALGVPIPCTFGIYTYGPYSDTITFSVESLMADDVLEDGSSKQHYSNYRLGPNGPKLLSEFAEKIDPHEKLIRRVVSALGEFTPTDLELIATLHFIAQRAKQLVGAVRKEQIIEEFKLVKKNKFSDDDISTWYDALQNAGLLPGEALRYTAVSKQS
jgi:hypothetical protein